MMFIKALKEHDEAL